MRFRSTPSFLVLLLAAAPWSAPLALAEGGPPVDDRFFPKEMEDSVAAMKGADPEDSFTNGLAALSRMRMKQGALDPMRKEAFGPVLEHGLSTRLEYVSSFAGELLSALDPGQAGKELAAVAEKESDEHRLFNAAAMLEEVRWPGEGQPAATDPVESLVRLSGKGSYSVRVRAAEALGEVAQSRRGCPPKSMDKAVSALLAAYGAAGGKESDLKNVCAVALGKLGSPRAVPSLLTGMGQTEGKHGFFAALALSWIEDPAIFAGLASWTAPTGETGEAFCKALEGSAREANVEALVSMVASAGREDLRQAAAIALARLLPAFPAPDEEGKPAGATPQEKERSAIRAKAASILFEAMVNGKNPAAQWACFHALSRSGGSWLEKQTVQLLYSPNAATIIRAVHLSGDWKLKSAASILWKQGIFATREDLLRRRCAIEFWRIGDRAAIDEFKQKLKESSGGVPFARGCDALGSWRCKEAYDFAVDLLRATRDGSSDQFAVELCLEKMTGHLFGNSPGIWNKWFEKNPNFFTPKQARIERQKWREDFDKENKGFRQTKETEKAVQMGLEYLARHQDQDGSWDPLRFRERCDRSPPCSVSTGARVQEDPVSRTALSILAFLGAGYTPEEGKYKCTLRRALEYMMARQQASGDYATNDLIGGYDRPVSLQAYAEACAVTHDPRFLPFIQRGADFLTQIQNSIGGWRYRVIEETSDSSVASWMLFSMKAAEKAGAHVREIVYEGTRLLMERYSVRAPKEEREDFVDIDPTYGFDVGKDKTYEARTGYQDTNAVTGHATTAVGLMAHILLGYRRSNPFCIGSANFLLAHQLPVVPKDGNIERIVFNQQYPMYFMYYGTLAMHQMGGKYFRKWNDQARVILPALQIKEGCGRGSWKSQSEDGYFGSLYTASMGVLAMETYYRYLPVLQD